MDSPFKRRRVWYWEGEGRRQGEKGGMDGWMGWMGWERVLWLEEGK